MNKATLLPKLEQAATQAGARILELRHTDTQVHRKQDGSPVTQADQEAEAIILAALRAHAAETAVVSEENAASHRQSPPRQFFLVDPLDGTREFLRPDGKGAFTVNIALIENGAPTLGVIHAPARGRLFSGIVGIGAWEESAGVRRPITVRPPPADDLLALVSRSHGDPETDAWLRTHAVPQRQQVGSSLKFCLLACGEGDVYPRFGPTMEWDTAAGDAILRAAGGTTYAMEGETLRYGKEGYRNGGFVAWGRSEPPAAA